MYRTSSPMLWAKREWDFCSRPRAGLGIPRPRPSASGRGIPNPALGREQKSPIPNPLTLRFDLCAPMRQIEEEEGV